MIHSARQAEAPFLTALVNYYTQRIIRFHTPGHKGGRGADPEMFRYLERALNLDVSDELESPEHGNDFRSVLEDAQELASEVWGADNTLFIANGTSGALHTSLLALPGGPGTVIMPRHVHLSVINGLILVGGRPQFLPPQYHEGIGIPLPPTPEEILQAVQEPSGSREKVAGCVLINPDYYGFAGDLRGSSAVLQKHRIPLVVDEAHGPHFRFHADLPADGMQVGADISVQSTHKLLGAFTQASMLHHQGELVSIENLYRARSVVASTSPSFLLYASLDAARRQMATSGSEIMERVLALSRRARSEINGIPGLRCYGEELLDGRRLTALDETKLLISVEEIGITGVEAEDELRRKYGIQVEMSDQHSVLVLVTLGDDEDSIDSLVLGLKSLAAGERRGRPFRRSSAPWLHLPPPPSQVLSPREAYFSSSRRISLGDSVGLACGEVVVAYPPGTIILCPGEEITSEAVEYLKWVLDLGLDVRGIDRERRIRVVAD